MAETTKIQWTDATFNPWIGCTKVSLGCDNCYAEALMDHRYHRVQWGPKQDRVRTSAANWRLPIRWNNQAAARGIRQRVFCASLADVFDNQVPDEWRNDLWKLIQATSHLDWLLLTKRPQNIAKMLPAGMFHFGGPWPNVWLGVTAENKEEAGRRISYLQSVPAAVRFLSCEPLIEEIEPNLRGISWVICGGESGLRAKVRHMDLDWARLLRDQCATAGVPYFFKQTTLKGPIPPDLMVRQFPVLRG